MFSITVSDFLDFRDRARACLQAGYVNEQITWLDAQTGATSLLPSPPFAPRTSSAGAPPLKRLKVPREYFELAQTVETHTNPKKWTHLYGLLSKISQRGPQVLKNAVDDDVLALRQMAKQIRRDIHKMHAFVRFRNKILGEAEIFIAWYEPDHFILKQAAPFFERRFGNMEWIIATPHGAAYWNKKSLRYHFAHLKRQDYEQAPDEFEGYWLSYYSHIFNPARIKVKAMKNEMPTRFWKNLPEAQLIGDLLLRAPTRVTEMHQRMQNQAHDSAEPFLPNEVSGPSAVQLEQLGKAATLCQGCPLSTHATQTVFGMGPATAKVVLVGEQPGNEEDLNGKPFVGPAGQVLRKVLAELGINENEIYFTNAVKHFHFEERGPIRLHKTPKTGHVRACKPWLARELKIIAPRLIICLGATASQAVVGFPLNMTRDRGRIFKTEFAEKTMITFHPSYLLRIKDDEEKKKIFAQFVNDLSIIKAHL